jgi:hypothetical protein
VYGADAPQFAIRQDGAVVITAPGNTSGLPPVMVVDGKTGAWLQTVNIPLSTWVDAGGQTMAAYSRIGPPMIDVDGVAHVMYEVRELAYPTDVVWTSLRLLKLAEDGTQTTAQLQYTTDDNNLIPGRVLPDGQGGVLATWTETPTDQRPLGQAPLKAARVTGGTVSGNYDLPLLVNTLEHADNGVLLHPELTLGEAGTAFVTYGNQIAAFAVGSGAPQWSHQVTGPSQTVQVVSAAEDNTVVTKTKDSGGAERIVTYDAAGVPSTSTWTGTRLTYYVSDLWLGATPFGMLSARLGTAISPSGSIWYSPGQFGWNRAKPAYYTNYNAVELNTTVAPQTVFDGIITTFSGVEAGNVATVSIPGDRVTGLDQVVTFTLEGVASYAQGPFSVRSVRFAPAAGTLAVETMPDHPLRGWRFWRAFTTAPGRLKVETGAFDVPAVNGAWRTTLNYVGYYILEKFTKAQTEIWRRYMEYIKAELAPSGATVFAQSLISGRWDHDHKYIMTHVCGQTPTAQGFCP